MSEPWTNDEIRPIFSETGGRGAAFPRRFLPWLILILSCIFVYAAASFTALTVSRHTGMPYDSVMRSAPVQAALTLCGLLGLGLGIVFLVAGLFGPACPRCWRRKPAFVKSFQGRVVVRCQRPDCGEVFVESLLGLAGQPLAPSDLKLVNHVETPRLDASELTCEEMATPTTAGILLKTHRNIRQSEGWVSLLSYRGNADIIDDGAERHSSMIESDPSSASGSLEKGAIA